MSKMHIVASAKHNHAEEHLYVPLEDYKYLYTNSKGCFLVQYLHTLQTCIIFVTSSIILPLQFFYNPSQG